MNLKKSQYNHAENNDMSNEKGKSNMFLDKMIN